MNDDFIQPQYLIWVYRFAALFAGLAAWLVFRGVRSLFGMKKLTSDVQSDTTKETEC
jgi:hypothetical protein